MSFSLVPHGSTTSYIVRYAIAVNGGYGSVSLASRTKTEQLLPPGFASFWQLLASGSRSWDTSSEKNARVKKEKTFLTHPGPLDVPTLAGLKFFISE